MTGERANVLAGDREPCPRCGGNGYIIRKRVTWPHGTAGRYFRLGCRCKWCKEAGSVYNAYMNSRRRKRAA